jgi:Memo-like protein
VTEFLRTTAVPVDDAARRDVLRVPHVVTADAPHAHEHSLEVPLPFLQALLDEFQVLAIAAGDATAREVAAALEYVLGNEETLIVVSSDLSHYLEYAAARSVDASTAQSILNCSTELGGGQACGCVGINGLMHVAREREFEVRLLIFAIRATRPRNALAWSAMVRSRFRRRVWGARRRHLGSIAQRTSGAQDVRESHAPATRSLNQRPFS